MEENPSSSNRGVPNWFIRSCKWLWKKQGPIWGTVIVGLGLNVIGTLLFIRWPWLPNPVLDNTLFKWILENPGVILMSGFFLLLCACIIYLGSCFEVITTEKKMVEIVPGNVGSDTVTASPKDVEQRYLNRMIRETEMLALKGIPAGLLAESVPLDEIFIPLQFRLNRPRADYPLTESELRDYQSRSEQGTLTEEMELLLFEAEKNWQPLLKKADRISITELWQRLTATKPVAVIQGYPGVGKSTFLARLTLHMARCGLHQSDPTMFKHLDPTLVPFLVNLGDYAIEWAKTSSLSLLAYLKLVLNRLHIPHLDTFLEECLSRGQCLILLDGLDEVGDLQMRKQVQEAISLFILEHRDPPGNRFLIASRVAGYDQNAFPDYPHYTVAELTSGQIESFLPRWCLANVRRDRSLASADGSELEEALVRDAEKMAKQLADAINTHQGVRELAENPLLLTLLLIMQQNSIELPSRRVELYSVITRTLLENRKLGKGLYPISEIEAIQRLGPLAFQMQTRGNSFVRRNEVIDVLKHAIGFLEGGTGDDIAQEAESFLNHIRERGGLFVLRAGDYFGFFHRTFQEYFAARHILNQIKQNADYWIPAFISMARHSDNLWRETFLLAVAFISSEDESVACLLISGLLENAQDSVFANRIDDLLLASECLIEAKPMVTGSALQREIAEQLLKTYEWCLRTRQFEICNHIELVMRRWLLSLPEKVYRSRLLLTLNEAISSDHMAYQHSTLTLLSMIAQYLSSGPAIVLNTLIPSLLALAGLPAIHQYQPKTQVITSDLALSDLALSALSFMGPRGPTGLLLLDVRQYFKDDPESLRSLARYSLEMGILLTIAVIPQSEDAYKSYESAVNQWTALLNQHKPGRIEEQEIDSCFKIHQDLLNYSEEACYPSAVHLLAMLQAVKDHPGQPWQQVWQSYMINQLQSSSYTHYHEIALLWTILFPEQEALKELVTLLLEHFYSDDQPVQRFAQHFIATMSKDLQYHRYLVGVREREGLQYLRYFLGLRNLRDIVYLQYFKYLKYLKYLRVLRNIHHPLSIRYIHEILYSQHTQEIQVLLLTQSTVEKTIELLTFAEATDQLDLLTILLGRVLQIREGEETSDAVERELQQIVQVTLKKSIATEHEEIKETALMIIRNLPIRSIKEREMVLKVAKEGNSQLIQQACAAALAEASSRTSQRERN